MSRTIMEYTLNQPDNFVQFITNDFFTKEGFRFINYNGELLWKKGTGVLTAPSFVKMIYANGVIHIEAFIKWFGEQGIEGVWGAIPKAQLKSRLDKLMQLLSQPGPAAAAPQYSQAPAFASASPDLEASVPPASQTSFGAEYPQSPSSQPAAIPVQVHNSTGYAVASLILGIAGLILC